jgi:hypothetical protein
MIRDLGSYQKKYPVWPGDAGRRNMYQFDASRILSHRPEQPDSASDSPQDDS